MTPPQSSPGRKRPRLADYGWSTDGKEDVDNCTRINMRFLDSSPLGKAWPRLGELNDSSLFLQDSECDSDSDGELNEIVVPSRAATVRSTRPPTRMMRLAARELGHLSHRWSQGLRALEYRYEARSGSLLHSGVDDRLDLTYYADTFPSYALTSLNRSPLVAVGSESGTVKLFDVNALSSAEPCRGTMAVHNNAIYDIEVDASEQYLLTASADQTACLIDLVTQRKIAELNSNSKHSIPSSVKQAKFNPYFENVVATSSRNGVVSFFDTRVSERAVHGLEFGNSHASTQVYNSFESLARPHAVYRATNTPMASSIAKKIKPSAASVTALAWAGRYTLITGGSNDGTLNFWDMRQLGSSSTTSMGLTASIPSPMASTGAPVTPGSSKQWGINSIQVSNDDNDRRVWALARDGRVYGYSLDSPQSGCLDVLGAPEPKKRGIYHDHTDQPWVVSVNSFYIKMALSPSRRQFSSRSSRQGDYIACGSSQGGIGLFARPSRIGSSFDSSGLHSTSSLVARLRHGHDDTKEITALHWNTTTDNLFSVGDDAVVRVWKENQTGLPLKESQSHGCGWAESI
ncbi:WD40 repeat-like protein [Nadsonia fulvescens var. elongata DSM 6958]|uniref:WD40 repeat-like protein n=1 Tax=Nadsonia fulvescens var. elongata DSM 6958 TaxID=857566 RepID=A0A1E3PQL7_9ASCO|nr:WD40 repeat-like protein [Nadsonia fulvescens var. elongata DSM 6958]